MGDPIDAVLDRLWSALDLAPTRHAARAELTGGLSSVPCTRLRELAQRMRHRRPSRHEARWLRWDELAPEDCFRLAREPYGWPVLALATLHASGYVREAALCALAPRADALMFVLASLNDWVPMIRDRARRIVRAYLTAEYASAWIAAFPLLEALGRARRVDHAPLVAEVLDLLSAPAIEPMLVEALGSPDPGSRHRCARILLQRPTAAIVRAGFASDDPLLRFRALEAAVATRQVDPDLLQRALRDRVAAIRRLALATAFARGVLDEAQVVGTFLLDPGVHVRALARSWLRRHHPGCDVAAVYRRAIVEDGRQRRRIALLGLGECGDAADAERIAPYLQDPDPPVRRCAVRALDALGDRVPGSIFVAMLADVEPAVAREAAAALAKRMAPSLAPDVWRAVERGPARAAIRAAACFARLDTWPALVQLCDLFPRAPDACAYQLRGWLADHRVGFRTRPDAASVARIRTALRWARGGVHEELVRAIELVLRTVD